MKKIIIAFLIFVSFVSTAQAWTVSADFESGTPGTAAEGSSGLTEANESGSTQNTYSNIRANTGSQSMKNHFVAGSTGSPGSAYATGGHIGHTSVTGEGSEIWGRFYLWIPSGSSWSWTCNPVVKVFRLAHIYASGGSHIGYISVFADSNGQILLSNELDGQANHERGTGVYFDRDSWQSIEIYIKFSTTSGTIRIWKNGVLAREETNYRTIAASTNYSNEALVWTYWNGNHPQEQDAWVDDIEITTDTPSARDVLDRAMIGPIGWSGVIGGKMSGGGAISSGGYMR